MIESQLEREEGFLYEQLEREEITDKQYSKALNELYRDAHAGLEQEAQDAYDQVMYRGW